VEEGGKAGSTSHNGLSVNQAPLKCFLSSVREVLAEGSRRARELAQATMERVRDAVHLRY